ncbi:MAG: CpsD/CapB family tyrosine-protein kinase [Steroidobacteraceae bacterium]|nr:CpsD/CapB family tyrosine-protein kinase [Steroidobacteraceae bacterium]MDW8259992.1 CpsD/CapB family tyrosine-protein kinase [Gammaproteobacteria bacterium]
MSFVERAVKLAQAQAKEKQKEVQTASTVGGAASPSHEAAGHAAAHPLTRGDKPVVAIDFARLRELGRWPPEKFERQMREEIRRIKWPLLQAIRSAADPARPLHNSVQITSALPGEGKSFIALMLALSIVRDRELRVVLVDGDVARPGLTPALSLDDRPGLIELLDNHELDISDVTYPTDVQGLHFIPSGVWHERSSELFASTRMPDVLGDLTQRLGRGVVVVDSPPLLATNEAQVLTRYVGQVVLVVRADVTEHRAIREAVALIDGGAETSAVLNGVRPSIFGRYYGEFAYGYGEAGERDASQADRSMPGA